MRNERNDFNSCNALIYDEKGRQLANSKILIYDEHENTIRVKGEPSLEAGMLCDVLILAAPTPFVYKGRVYDLAHYKIIRLFQGKSSCKRRETRYNAELPAMVEGLVYDGKLFPLKMKMGAQVINISKSGLRFRAGLNALTVGNRFQLRMKIGADEKLLTADVVNSLDVQPNTSEFGCRLVS
jgi:hypothetical protein